MSEIIIKNNRTYVSPCPTCLGSDAPEHNLCPECFGAGIAPVFEPERFSFARSFSPENASSSHAESQGNGGKSTGNRFANKFAGKCLNCNGWVEAFAGLCTRDGQRWVVQHSTCPEAQSAPTAKPEPTPTVLSLVGIPTGNYAVPGGDTRLKVRIEAPLKGKWSGWIFVKDGAEYGQGQRYGSQKPGENYKGKIADALAAIAADPKAAAAAYGHLTGTCGVCGRHLEDPESVARGIGPICNEKF